MTRDMMIIFRDGDGYSIEHLGRYGAQVKQLFSTTILPTPYRRGTRPRAVQDALQRLNPACDVCLHPNLLNEETLAAPKQ